MITAAISGRTFSALVITWTFPAERAPPMTTTVKRTTKPIDANAATPVCANAPGASELR